MSLLSEIRTALTLGFETMADFERALINREIPAPAKTMSRGRRKVRMWSDKDLTEWIDGEDVDVARRRKERDIADMS